MSGCVYIHINKENGKVYVGQTKDTYHRWRAGYKQQPYFRKAIEAYGWDNFDHLVVVDSVDEQEKLDNLEKLWIILLKATDRDRGYNLIPGGLRERHVELARMGGLAANQKEENRNRLKNVATFETCSVGGKRGSEANKKSGLASRLGKEQGNKNKETGHWDRIRLLGNPFTPEDGRKQGLKNIENGHLKNLDQGKKNAAKPGYMKDLGKQGGKKGGPIACHIRWHVKRNIINSLCPLCRTNNQ